MEALYIILGSFLTFGATLAVEAWKNSKDLRDRERSVTLFLKLEFADTLKALDAIKTKHEASRYYDYGLLNDLDKNIQNLESVRRETIYLSNLSKQEEYFKLATDLGRHSRNMRQTQQLYADQSSKIEKKDPDAAFTKEELDRMDTGSRAEIASETIDLKRRIGDFLKS